MPIYEFYCPHCHVIFNFLSRSIETRKRPDCPRCGGSQLQRRVSSFAISKGRAEPAADDTPDLDEERMERAMTSLAGEVDRVDEDDPRQVAGLMRRFCEASGLPLGGAMEEAIHRMEAGQDPDRIEEEMGDRLEDENPFGPAGARAVRALRRRLRPPDVDPTLYEM